jgi:hypothetical protein
LTDNQPPLAAPELPAGALAEVTAPDGEADANDVPPLVLLVAFELRSAWRERGNALSLGIGRALRVNDEGAEALSISGAAWRVGVDDGEELVEEPPADDDLVHDSRCAVTSSNSPKQNGHDSRAFFGFFFPCYCSSESVRERVRAR